ncbi:MAG: hypothetical protein B6D56_08460 [Candidatus Omnitrophica bacterium 4484_70.1]|nr:MAG: hypothetical protein B6D56_08460 [Candidatus Omnitrophica bacterium 4484_70.1]
MYKVLICDKLSEEGIKILENAGIEVDCRFEMEKDELKEIIKDYDAVIVRSQTKIDAEIIEKAERLKFIGRAGVGVDSYKKGYNCYECSWSKYYLYL